MAASTPIPTKIKLLFMLIPLGMLILSVILLVTMLLWWNDYKASADWPTVMGTVTDLESGYNPYIEYSYVVNERTYTSIEIYFRFLNLIPWSGENGADYLDHNEAEHYMNKYPLGTAVTVLYNPANPRQAILERKFDYPQFYAAVGAGLVFAAIGLAACAYSVASILNPDAFPNKPTKNQIASAANSLNRQLAL